MPDGHAVTLTGVLVGGLLATIPVVLSGLFAWRQWRGEQRFAVKRQVYLEVAEWAARSATFLMGIPLDEVQSEKFRQDYLALQGVPYKVHVVGDEFTILSLSKSQEAFTHHGSALMAQRARMLDLEDDFKTFASKVDESLGALEALVGREPPPAVADRQAQVREIVAECERSAAVARQSRERLQESRTQLHRRATLSALEFSEYLVEFNIAARRDLRLKLDERAYRAEMHASYARLRAFVDEIFPPLGPVAEE